MGSFFARSQTQTQTQGEISLRSNMIDQRENLQEIIESEFGLLAKLVSKRVLTPGEKDRIDARETTLDKNRMLLEIIFEKGKYQEFAEALNDSGQRHVVNWITGNGVYTNEFGLDWPLTEKEIHILDGNYEQLGEILGAKEDLIGTLYSKEVVNSRQMEFVSSRSTSYAANEAFLKILRRFSLKNYFLTAKSLRELNQSHVANILENGGVAIPVHATLMGQNIKEMEEILVREMANLIQRRKAGLSFQEIDLSRLFIRLCLEIIAAIQGHSVVLYLCCREMQGFRRLCAMVDGEEMKEIIEQLFNLLLRKFQTKIRLVTIAEVDRQKAKRFFLREEIRDKTFDEHFRKLRSQLIYAETPESEEDASSLDFSFSKIVSCRAKLYEERITSGTRAEFYLGIPLTVCLCLDHHGTHCLFVLDQDGKEVLKIRLIRAEVARYSFIKSYFSHEIQRTHDSTLFLELVGSDENASEFCENIKRITSDMGIFHSTARPKDSGASHSGSGNNSGLAGTVDGWECSDCHHFNEKQNRKQCEKCDHRRDNIWECDCREVHTLEFFKCVRCGSWRCTLCTFINNAASHDRCGACLTLRHGSEDTWKC